LNSPYSTVTTLQRKRYLFVCINRRGEDNPKGCCAAKDSEEVYKALKEEVAARGLAKLEARLVGEIDAHYKLKDRLAAVASDFDAVVIDCPPALGLLTVNALVASTHLLIPIQSSYFALEGTDDLLETIEKVRSRANPALRILRDVGLGIVDRLPGLKRRFIDAASGGGDGAPRLLRGEAI